jgi:hypothetical protein
MEARTTSAICRTTCLFTLKGSAWRTLFQAFVTVLCAIGVGSARAQAASMENTENSPRSLVCSETIKPNRLVVSGGISASSVRPKQGSDQIEQQLALMRAYVKGKQGLLIEKERLRAARNPEGNSDGVAKLPFIQVQRIEVDFPTSVDVDEILERLLKMGMDRYGKDSAIEGYATREFKTLTGYRFSNIEEILLGIRGRCMRQAAQKLCGELNADSCVKQAVIYSSSAQTESVAARDGYKRSFNLTLPVDIDPRIVELEPLELSSAQPFRVRVSVTIKMGPNALTEQK